MTDARFEDGREAPLNLGALDAEDLEVLSSLAQDAVFPVTEMRWDRKAARFESARSAWRTATEAIRKSPHYGGLELEPQFGLLPIGPGPHGHWEFLHLPTGRDDCEDWVSGSQPSLVQHGCVLVLLPAGRDKVQA